MMGPPAPGPPQIPDQNQAPGTLGDVNQQMAPPGNPYIEQFLQLRQGLGQMTDRLKLPLDQNPHPPPNLLTSLATFGMANLKHIADENTRREENYRRFVQNRAIDMQANQMAMHLLNGQAQASALAGRSTLANQRMMLDLMKYKQALDEHAYKVGHDQIQDELKDTLPAPTTPQGYDMLTGQGYGPSKRFNSRWEKLTEKPSGGWDLPANSPMAQALGNVGGGTAPSGASPSDVIRQKEVQGKIAAKVGGEQASAAADAEANMRTLEDYLKDPKFDMAVASTAISGPGAAVAGPIRSFMHRAAGRPGQAYLGQAGTLALPAMKALESSAKGQPRLAQGFLREFGLAGQLERIADNKASAEEMRQFKRTVLDRIKSTRALLQGGEPGQGGGGSAPTAGTTTTSGQLGTARRLSSGKLIQELP